MKRRISDQRGSLDAGSASHVGTEIVEVDVEDLQHPPLIGGERGRLQVGEQPFDLLDRPMLDQARQGQLLSDEPDRGDEQLRIVTAQLGGCRRHGRSAEVDEAQTTVVDDEMLLVELAVDEPVVVQGGQESPELAEPWQRLGVSEDRFGCDVDLTEAVVLHERRARAAQHEQCVVAGGGSRSHHGVGGDAGLRSKQRHQRLVFDLTEATETNGRSGLAQPDRPPHRRHQRGVVGVAPVQLHDQFAPVGPPSGDGEEAGVLPVGRPEVGDVDVHVGQRETDVVEAGPAGARSDDQVHDRSCAGGRQQRGEHTQRRARPECNGGDRTQRDDRVAETPGRPDQVG